MTRNKIRQALDSIGCDWKNHSNVFVQIRNNDIAGAIGTLYAGSAHDVFKQKRKELKAALK